MRLEIELGGDALLDAVEQRQLGGALLELRCPLGQCRPKAFPLVCARYDQCCPPGEPRDEIALFALESAKLTLDIEIQIAEGRLGEQRSNQAGALVGRRNALRPVPKTRSQGAPRLRQPWCDRLQQFSVGLPLRQPGAGHFEPARRLQHQQHASRGAKCTGFIDQQPMQFGDARHPVQGQVRADDRRAGR